MQAHKWETEGEHNNQIIVTNKKNVANHQTSRVHSTILSGNGKQYNDPDVDLYDYEFVDNC